MANGSRSALLVGASGLVGGHCLNLLLENDCYSRVVALGRRILDVSDSKLVQAQVDFERLPDERDWFAVDDVFCCLGSTIAKAGSREAFARVDRDYPRAIAKKALQQGAKQFLLVSSVGANPKSRNFYLRTKGEVERDVSALGFAAVHIFRPSMLLGDREEFRWKEKIFEPVVRMLSVAMIGSLRPYRAIEARDVAKAMVRAAVQNRNGMDNAPRDLSRTKVVVQLQHVYEGDSLARLGAK